MKNLYIAEKPSVARQFADVLGVKGNAGNGYLESDTAVVTWCVGHLVTMSYPEVYDPNLKKWSLSTIPFIPTEYKYEVLPDTKKQFNIVAGLLTRDDIGCIYVATDSGREGEYIYRLVDSMAHVTGKEKRRVWIDSQTEEEILRGIREAKPLSEYDSLSDAAYLRAQEDYLMGINFSRALSLKFSNVVQRYLGMDRCVIAVGRVMTCVLGIIVKREREIREFVKTPFYRLVANVGEEGQTFDAEWKAVKGTKYFESPLLYKENGFKERPAAEQLLPTADVMFKLWPGRLFRAEHGLVLLLGQAVQRPDVLRGKGLLWGQHPRNAVREHADHRIRDLLRHVQLVQADDHGQPLLMGQFLQDGQKLDLSLDIQKRGRLVQQQNSGLLADGTGQQNALALAVADAVEIPARQRGSPHQFQRIPHGLPVGIGQDAQPPGIGDAPGGGKLKAGSQLGAAGMGQHQGQLPGPGCAGVIGQTAAIQQDSPAQGGQLACQRFEQGGFSRAVWPDEGQDLPRHRPQRDAGSKGRAAIADGQFFRFTAVFHRTPS